MRKLVNNFLTSVLLLTLLCSASQSNETQLSKQILDNGLTVLIKEMPSSPVVSVYALVKTGSATEGRFLGTGISHFLEHMLFKGTHGRDVGELASRVQAVGGSINAATSMDYTIYTITVPHESFDVALEILADMLMNATMDKEEIERERTVIFGEMRLRRDDPARKFHEIIFQNVYLRHPYRHPIIGYESLLAKVSQEDLKEYYRNFYTPNNTVLSIAGNINTVEIFPKIQATFKGFKRGAALIRNLPEEPPQISRRHYEEEYPTELARLSMSFVTVRLLHPDLYALDVLAAILGQGRSSRLYLDVYKKQGLVHSISASNYTPMDKGVFEIDCLLEEQNTDDVIENVLKHIAQIQKSGVKPEELDKVKQKVKSDHILNNQKASRVTYAQAVDEFLTGDPHFSKKYIEGIGRVTNDDIKRVANQYLVDRALTTVVLKPKQKKTQNQARHMEHEANPIQKHVLNNGLTVLLREDHTFPLISIRLSANGGVRQEPIKLNGLSEMMASTWIKGTKRFSADTIAKKTESLGMHLGSFSGRNSFGLNMEFLTEHLPVAWDLLKELAIAPEFPEAEMNKVRDNMKASIRQRDDNVFQSTAHVLKETLFLTHPFRLEQEGTLETVEAITRDDLVKFYNQFAVSRNMVLSVFGDIDAGEILKDIEKVFGELKDGDVDLLMYKEASPQNLREKAHTMDKEQAVVMAGFHGVALRNKDLYGIDVMTSILGSSFSGRLFNNIRDQLGGAYTLGGSFIPGPDAGMIYFYIMTTDEKAAQVKDILKKEITRLQSEAVPDKELNAMKTYLKGTFKASLETSSALSFTASLDELYGLGYERYKAYDQNIDRVTAEDIQRLARQYLDLNKMAIVVTRPQKSTD